MNKAKQLIGFLESEIAKRDARIVGLELEVALRDQGLDRHVEYGAQLRAELAAIKAREPVAFAFHYDDGSWHDVSATQHSAGMVSLYGAPVPEAKAQGVVIPRLGKFKTSEGGRSYVAEFFKTALQRHDFTTYINERLAADFACALADGLYQLNAAPVQQASVPDGWKLVPVEPTHEMLGAALMNQVECLDAVEVIRTDYKAMLAAAPAPGGE